MVKAFKRTFRYLIYEIIILGVLYDAILAFHLIGRNTSGVLFLSLIVALFVGQWGYFIGDKTSDLEGMTDYGFNL